MKKDYYNQFIAELKLTGLCSEFSEQIADLICNDDIFEGKATNEIKQEAYKSRMTKVKKAIKSTFINA